MVRSSYFRDERLRLEKRKMAFPDHPMALAWSYIHTKSNTEIQTDRP